jgi:hypothetical protein
MTVPIVATPLSHVQRFPRKNPFDRGLTPLALSIDRQEGTLTLVGYRFAPDPLGPSGSHAGLEEVVPRAQTSFGRK